MRKFKSGLTRSQMKHKVVRPLLVVGATLTAALAVVTPAQADAGGSLHNVATGLCLDSNSAGAVYTLGCNGGRNQVWLGGNDHSLYDYATGLCLDSNTSGDVYALGCNGGDYQKWDWQVSPSAPLAWGRYVNRKTGRCLDSNSAGAVYALSCNGGNNQYWGG
jgi:hypothetical protein